MRFIIFFIFNFLFAKNVVLGTGHITGVYYKVGGAVCRTLNLQSDNLRCLIDITEGSKNNLIAVKSKEIDFGIVQSNEAYKAFKKGGKIRVVMALHPELLALIVRKDSGIKSFYQIRGHRVNVGTFKSGTFGVVKELIKVSRLKWNSFKAVNFYISESPKLLKNRMIDGYFYMVGHPNRNIKEAANLTNIDLISFYKIKAARELVKKYPYYAWGVIPSGTYKGVNHPTLTYGLIALLVSRADMDNEVVYKLVKAVLVHFNEFKKFHPLLKHLKKRDLLKGFDLKMLHPGAKRAFIEEGIL